MSSPLQFFRSEDFTIASTIVHRCSDSLSVSVQWTVYNCADTTCSSLPIDLPTTINTRSTEFFAPPKSLPLGLYRLIYTVSLVQHPHLISTIQTHLRIRRTGITLNLLPYGTSTMSRGTQQEIFFNPGHYSLDPDQDTFDPSVCSQPPIILLFLFSEMMTYCRCGDTPITVDGSACGTILDHNKVCSCHLKMLISTRPHHRVSSIEQVITQHLLSPSLSLSGSIIDNQTSWMYGNSTTAARSSLRIQAGSIRSNRTYQFMAIATHLFDPSIQANVSVLVNVEETHQPLIVIG